MLRTHPVHMPRAVLLIGMQPAKRISNQVFKTNLNTVLLHRWSFRNVTCEKWYPHSVVDVFCDVRLSRKRHNDSSKYREPLTYRHRVTSHRTWIPHC